MCCFVLVIILCANADSIREIMITAANHSFDNGDYVFFNIDLFSRWRSIILLFTCISMISRSIKMAISRPEYNRHRSRDYIYQVIRYYDAVLCHIWSDIQQRAITIRNTPWIYRTSTSSLHCEMISKLVFLCAHAGKLNWPNVYPTVYHTV